MAKVKAKKIETKQRFQFPLERTNFLILIFGLLVLIVGYIFMAVPEDPDAFLTRTLSPILLVIGYLVIIPIGLFYREKKKE